jgi:hypothetical protein
MAQADLDNYKQDTREPKTAEQMLDWTGELISDVANAEAAATAGVKDAAFINYGEALAAYAARPDIEDLAARRARDFPATFDDASFMRESGYGSGSSGV